MGWNSVCPLCGANIETRIGKTEMFKCECCDWKGIIKGGRTVGEGWGRP